MYFCVYNGKTKEIRFQTEDKDPIRMPYTRQSFVQQARQDGPDWQPYWGEIPFSWPLDTTS